VLVTTYDLESIVVAGNLTDPMHSNNVTTYNLESIVVAGNLTDPMHIDYNNTPVYASLLH
jgi:putative N-acetylmannosamine-6-phosphate epimerase